MTMNAAAAPGDGGSSTAVAAIPLHDARALVGSGQVAHLVLDGVTYVLRITRQGKLILTK